MQRVSHLILRQRKDVNDHVFKRFVSLPILNEELPLSLKTIKHVDKAGSGCSIQAVLILVQEWLFSNMTWINVEGIQMRLNRGGNFLIFFSV